jgi:hypothetical protein
MLILLLTTPVQYQQKLKILKVQDSVGSSEITLNCLAHRFCMRKYRIWTGVNYRRVIAKFIRGIFRDMNEGGYIGQNQVNNGHSGVALAPAK